VLIIDTLGGDFGLKGRSEMEMPEKRYIVLNELIAILSEAKNIQALARHINEARNEAIDAVHAYLRSEECREKVANVIREVEDCPNCPNQGWYEEGDFQAKERVTRDMALDAGDPSLEGSVCREATGPEQVQCQFCYENPKSRFNLPSAILSAIAGEGGK
jgi:hypothetical protein